MDSKIKEALDKLNNSDLNLMGKTLDRFDAEFKKKFIAGTKKYTTPLIRKDLHKNAFEEILDAAAYLTALYAREEQLKTIVQLWNSNEVTATDAMFAIDEILTPLPDGRVE